MGSFGTGAGVCAKDILMEILGCGIAPGLATTFIQLSQNPSPPPGLFSLGGGVGAGIASGVSLYELPRLASVAQAAQGPIEVSGLGAVGGSLGGVALSATAGGIMYGATGVPWAGYVIAASPAYRLGLAARWLRDYRRV